MIPFEVSILGSSSATPTANRYPTSQLINFRDKYFLFDCGEGTQHQLRRYKLSFSKIDYIFISHLHGDHFFGLSGLLSSFHLLGRTKELHLFAPAGLQEILEVQFKITGTKLTYPLIFHAHPKEGGVILDEEHFAVQAYPLRHSIACWGFVFSEKELPRKIDKEKIEQLNVPIHARHKLKLGEDYVSDSGEVIPNAELTFDPPKPRSYGFFTDTKVMDILAPELEGLSVLYHEATFLEAAKGRAKQTFHSTSIQAANFAKAANVGQLYIGHFSARYKDLSVFLEECRPIFPDTHLALEGTKIIIE